MTILKSTSVGLAFDVARAFAALSAMVNHYPIRGTSRLPYPRQHPLRQSFRVSALGASDRPMRS